MIHELDYWGLTLPDMICEMAIPGCIPNGTPFSTLVHYFWLEPNGPWLVHIIGCHLRCTPSLSAYSHSRSYDTQNMNTCIHTHTALHRSLKTVNLFFSSPAPTLWRKKSMNYMIYLVLLFTLFVFCTNKLLFFSLPSAFRSCWFLPNRCCDWVRAQLGRMGLI